MDPAEILKMPYARQVVPQPDGVFKAEILEFPGCFAVADTAAEALAQLEEVAVDWLAAAFAQGQNIPSPTESDSYSGKFVLRISKTLHKKATQFAFRDGVSLNQFISNCVAECVGLLARPAVYAHPVYASESFGIVGSGPVLDRMSTTLTHYEQTTLTGQAITLSRGPARDRYNAET